MQRVVICGVHGGFGLSREAFLRLRELGSDVALTEPDIGEMYDDGSGPRTPFGSLDSFCREIPRDSPLLLQVIEELGSEKASSQLCKLVVVDVPDGVEWEIEEYDGSEWVSEKHRTWR